ncbi:PREDICTED: protein LONGIFOLIA 2-like isoform X3 [Camelina sativa]|uniref:Protein LONGIFOLIA 2-like isoform X3 n=1 Tax=Camelina sativa TaxID=90675 RepID=A0ABM0YAT9_CAMSA|nr:PREDICTED: protein LONGIFOLIA 2-like isoform X3 [Camelina sativa]
MILLIGLAVSFSTLASSGPGESSWLEVDKSQILHTIPMAAKLLHTLADENKKFGCMNGIFQIFDRHHVLTSRPKSLTLGNVHVNSINLDSVDAICHQRSAFQFQDSNITSGNGSSEKLTRVSTEASKVSFSSSCSSSSPLSSEVNREVQPEISTDDRVIFPESPASDPTMSQGSGTRMGLDLRDVVRDSMYREVRGLSEVCRHNKREDSPRPYGLKQSTPVDFNESCRALAKLRKTSHHYYNEADMKDASRYYVDSRGKSKSGKKLKELPKLSLDSRDHTDLKSGNKLFESLSRSSSMNKVSGSPKRPPSVVAKLMGLETLPGSPLGRDKINLFDDNSDPFSRSLRENSLNRSLRFSPSSPRSLGKDPASSSSPRWRSSEFVMKPLSSLRYPIEQAPWKQTDRNRFLPKQACRPVKSLSRSMEGRLTDLEFKHSGKDLSALKEILEAMQSKGLFDTRKQPQCINLEAQRDYEMADSATSNHDSGDLRNPVMPSKKKGPIVIMKPARLVEKSGIPSSSLIPIHSLSGIHKTSREEPVYGRKNSTSRKAAKDRSHGNQRAESCISSIDKKSSSRKVRSSQVSRESTSKNSGSTSPKLHQMKHEHEHDKRSRPPTSPSDSSKSRKQTNRQPAESTTSPGGRRSKPRDQRSLQQNDDQLSQMSNKSRTETEATVSIKNGGKSPSVMEAAKAVVSNLIQNKSSPTLSEDGSSEHPSPVSVLNATIYREIEPSPMKVQTCEGSVNGLIESGVEHYEEDQWNPAYSFSKTTTSFSPEMNRKKLQNVEHLVQKLRRLNSSHDETSQDYIASLCENIDPSTDQRYISEILLASGLLLRDLGSGLTTFQLHPSGHPINPELFLVLEQTKGCSNSSNEKLNRKLVFDAVNEMLVKKLAYVESTTDPWMKQAKARKRVLSAQHLLKELCSEIETLQKQAKKRSENFLLLEEEEEDFLKCILDEDMAIRSGKWTDFDDVIPGLVLDLERLLFKDLVSEIVHGEIGRLQANSRRQKTFSTDE